MTISNPKYSHKDVGLTEPKPTKQMKDNTKVNLIACLFVLIAVILMVFFWSGCNEKAKPTDNPTPIDTNVYREVKCIFNPIKANYFIGLQQGSTKKTLNIAKNIRLLFGDEFLLYLLDLPAMYPLNKMFKFELQEAITKAKHILRGVIEMNEVDTLPRTPERRWELRNQFNKHIGIYI